MAYVTYHGPRPELVPSFPMPMADFLVDESNNIQVVYYGPKRLAGERHFVTPVRVVLQRDVVTHVPALFALGLAMIRKMPSPWFTVKMAPGEWAEIAHRIPTAFEDDCFCSRGAAVKHNCPHCHGTGLMKIHWPLREAVLRYLHWSKAQVTEFYEGEQRRMFVNGEEVWHPATMAPYVEGERDASHQQGPTTLHGDVRAWDSPAGRALSDQHDEKPDAGLRQDAGKELARASPQEEVTFRRLKSFYPKDPDRQTLFVGVCLTLLALAIGAVAAWRVFHS